MEHNPPKNSPAQAPLKMKGRMNALLDYPPYELVEEEFLFGNAITVNDVWGESITSPFESRKL